MLLSDTETRQGLSLAYVAEETLVQVQVMSRRSGLDAGDMPQALYHQLHH